MKYKNIFITGSTGVVGKPLLKKLIENGHNVYALSRSEENKKILESKGASVISGNILTSNLIDQFKNTNIDAIFHVAGVNKMCSKNPQYMFDANIDGTKNILNLGNQLTTDLETSEGFASVDYERILIVGMGGSGVAGDVLKLILNQHTNIDVEVRKTYNLTKNQIAARPFCLFISYSGNTEETISVAKDAIY